jgi:hypothetical protein
VTLHVDFDVCWFTEQLDESVECGGARFGQLAGVAARDDRKEAVAEHAGKEWP